MWKCTACGLMNSDDNATECISCKTKRIIVNDETKNNTDSWALNNKKEKQKEHVVFDNNKEDIPKLVDNREIKFPEPKPPKPNNTFVIILGSIAAIAILISAILIINISSHDTGGDENSNISENEVYSEYTEENTGSESTYFVNTFDDSGIFVRSGPGKEYSDILYIAKGDTSVRLLYLDYSEVGGDGFTWYQVQIPNGDIGYVREDVVRVD